MRIQYFLSVLLSVFVMVSACQHGVDRMYMDSNGSPATGQAKEESHVSSIPSQALISAPLDTNTPNGHGDTLPVMSSNRAHGALASTGDLVTMLSQHHENPGTKPLAAEVVQSTGTDEKKEGALQDSSYDHEIWFYKFVDAVDHAEEWSWREVAGVLIEGGRCGYLDKGMTWDDDQYTPLHYAAEAGDLEIVEELVEEHNISIDIRTGICGRVPLHFAALRGHISVVEYLVDRGAELSAPDKDGSFPLHYAALGVRGEANTGVVKYLHDKGANLGIVLKGLSLLHLAIRVSNKSLVDYLLTECSDLINQKIGDMTPLEYAQGNRETYIVEAIQAKMDNDAKPCWQLLPNCHIQ